MFQLKSTELVSKIKHDFSKFDLFKKVLFVLIFMRDVIELMIALFEGLLLL